ncbi:MAG: long-chain fatty acid--CoA ligase [Chthonomonas sp.]|nr:long-chain fatty acid--CoA ligase [Chthonomonas sp.]
MAEMKSVGALLRRSVERNPGKVAHIVPWAERGEVTYAQLWEYVTIAAWRMDSRGIKRGDRICAYSENCFGWSVLDWACFCLGVVLVPIYPSLPGDQAGFIVNDSEAKIIYCGSEKLQAQVEPHISVPTVYLGSAPEDFFRLMDEGRATMPADYEAQLLAIIENASLDDLATIIYTSGTTGSPKGAMLPNRAFVKLCENIHSQLPVDENDLFLSWLPLSHVYERFAGHVLPMALGGQIAHSQGIASLGSELTKHRPTIMLCVPRFLESLKDRISDAAAKQGGLKAKLFGWAVAQGKVARAGGFAPFHGVLDKVVASKIRARTGGRLKFFVSGGGALPAHVSGFYRALGIEALQGYGLTETCAATSINHPLRNRPDTIGEPINGLEMKIASDGEILIRGYSVMTGYYNQPEATAASIDADGWFHTGDIGVQDGNHFRITDRKKDIIVLANGKNVAPQPIENKLRESALIKEVALFGDGMSVICGLVVPDFERLTRLALEAGIKVADPKELVKLPAIREMFKAEIDVVNRGLADFERLRKYEVLPNEFSVDGGELTPSLKVRRKVVREKYKDLIDGMSGG